MTALGGHQREAFLQVKTHLMAENGDRASAGAVIFWRALGEHFLHQIKILFHGSSRILLLRTVAVSPNHHNDTRKHHRDRKICPMLMYCTQPPVNWASGWRKNSTMMRNRP